MASEKEKLKFKLMYVRIPDLPSVTDTIFINFTHFSYFQTQNAALGSVTELP